MTEQLIKVMIVEDDKDFTVMIQKLLSRHSRIRVVCAHRKRYGIVEAARQCSPDIVLMDLHLGSSSMDGIRASREIRIHTNAKVLIFTALDSPEIIQKAAKEAFASGYIFKNQLSLLVENIFALAEGYTADEYLVASSALSCLTEAEMSVFQIMMGKDIELQSTKKTIANQKTRIIRKLGLENQKELEHVFKIFKESGKTPE